MTTKTDDGNIKVENMSRKDNVTCLIPFSLHLTDFITPQILVIYSALAPANTFIFPMQFPYLILLSSTISLRVFPQQPRISI
jgi:hypothetical protein